VNPAATYSQLTYERSVRINVSCTRAFDFCATRLGFESHFPHRVRAYVGPEHWTFGTHFRMQYRALGMWLSWHGEIVEWQPGRRFVDVMHLGAFRAFRHEHEFEAEGSSTRYTDRLTFTLGLGQLVDLIVGRPLLERTFAERQRLLKWALENRASG
jgi:ligand-binding SRPBCC domain-containing protein